MKYLLIFISFIPYLAFAQFSPAALDSIRTVARTTGGPAKAGAASTLLVYYARSSQMDSALKYCRMALQTLENEVSPSFRRDLSMFQINFNMAAAFTNNATGYESLFWEHLGKARDALAPVDTASLSPEDSAQFFARKWSLEVLEGNFCAVNGRYKTAEKLYKKSIEIYRNSGDTMLTVNILINLASIYIDQLNIAEAGAKADSIDPVQLRHKLDAAATDGLALARTYLKAHPYDFDMARQLVYILNNMSIEKNSFNTEQEADEYQALMLESLRVAREAGIADGELLNVEKSMLLLLRRRGRLEKAMQQADKILQKIKEMGLDRQDIEIETYKQRGGIHFDLREYEKGLADFQTSFELAEKNSTNGANLLLLTSIVDEFDRIPFMQRRKFRKVRKFYESKVAFYREKAGAESDAPAGTKPN